MPAPARPLPLTEWLPVFEVLSNSLPVTLPPPQAFLSFPFLFLGVKTYSELVWLRLFPPLYCQNAPCAIISNSRMFFFSFLPTGRAITIPRDTVPRRAPSRPASCYSTHNMHTHKTNRVSRDNNTGGFSTPRKPAFSRRQQTHIQTCLSFSPTRKTGFYIVLWSLLLCRSEQPQDVVAWSRASLGLQKHSKPNPSGLPMTYGWFHLSKWVNTRIHETCRRGVCNDIQGLPNGLRSFRKVPEVG